MRKRLVAIYSVLVVAIVLLAVFVPSCTGGATGTIEVKATLCGAPWPTQGTGAVSYTLTPGTGSAVNGTSVPATQSGVPTGSWNCTYNSGGPAGAFLKSIDPSATQTVSEGGTITFTLNFELDQDAAIGCLYWTQCGVPYLDDYMYLEPCQWLDFHFWQWVDGCDGYQVAVNETSWLQITQTFGAPAQIFVVNDWCALNKTPAPIQKVSQVPSIDEVPVEAGMNITLQAQTPVTLDVETIWTLVKCLNYTKSISWLGISVGVPEPGHDCVLFELVLPGSGVYTFTLHASAEVALMNDVDVNSQNNKVMCPQLLNLTVTVP